MLLSKPVVKVKRQLDDSMIPAINIIFLLLVFFMVVGQIQTQDANLQLPSSLSESGLDEEVTIMVQLLGQGEVRVNNETIEQSLEEWLLANTIARDHLMIQIHASLPVTVLDSILAAERQIGFEDITLMTDRAL
jgi:biopolymer transport protein ExbD